MRGNGERIGPQNLPTSSVAGGIWNLLNQQRAQQRGAWPSATPAVVTDPYFMYVPLLLNTTSTNGQQNNTFLDSSTNNFTITRNGTPTQGAFTPYQPSGYWSGVFNGSSDYLSIANATALQLASSAWTIEGWFYVTAGSGTDRYLLVQDNGFTDPNTNWALRLKTTNVVRIVLLTNSGTTASFVDGTTTINLNTWYHIAASCDGTGAGANLRLWVNGNYEGGTTFNSSQLNVNSAATKVMAWPAASSYTSGYSSNVRIIKGTAVYTGASSITVPTTPLTAITNTSLLTLQSNRFIDNSSNAFAITVNGTPKVQAFQPFAPAASYSAATYGGSVYSPGGSGGTDRLNVTGTSGVFGSGVSYTMECWFYTNAAYSGDAQNIITVNTNTYPTRWLWDVIAGSTTIQLRLITESNAVLFNGSAVSYALNQWVHLAIVNNVAANTCTFYINGVAAGSRAAASLTSYATLNLFCNTTSVSVANPAYYSNFRIVNGVAVYTGAFTPPTLAPLQTSGAASAASYPSTTNVNTSFGASNTALLTNFTNAGIYDAAWQNNALTVGDAQASTTQKQWGTTSMKFDGTGDYLDILNSSPAFNLTAGDWTIEAWIYRSVANANHCIINLVNAFGSNSGLSIYVNSSNQLATDNGIVGALSGGTVPANQWVYLAIVRSSGTTTGYVNGTSIGTNTQAPATAQYARIGALGGGGSPFNGYIQDLRITKGVARTITTPTAAFPTR